MLNLRERAVLDALIPPRAHPALKLGIFEAGFEDFYRGFQAEALWTLRWGFKAALWVAAWVAPVLIRRLPPITLLDPGERERALEALERSPVYALRQCLQILKAVSAFGYGASPAVRSSVGFPRPGSPASR